MKKATLLSALLVALALSPAANASLLVGWHDFDGTTNPSSAVSYTSGFSGFLYSTVLSSENAGSTDGTYGNLASPTVPINDGHARLGTGTMSFTVSNSSGQSVALQSLFFDANANSGSIQQFEITYQIGAAPAQTLATVNPPAGAGNSNFPDYAYNLIGNLASGETLTVFMKRLTSINGDPANGNLRIDNIAISAIPEPASLLALGCVLGSGLMLRNRRRPTLTAA